GEAASVLVDHPGNRPSTDPARADPHLGGRRSQAVRVGLGLTDARGRETVRRQLAVHVQERDRSALALELTLLDEPPEAAADESVELGRRPLEDDRIPDGE